MTSPSLVGGLRGLKPPGLQAVEGWKGPGLFEEMLGRLRSWGVWAGRDLEPEAGRSTTKWSGGHHSVLPLVADLGIGTHKGFLAKETEMAEWAPAGNA